MDEYLKVLQDILKTMVRIAEATEKNGTMVTLDVKKPIEQRAPNGFSNQRDFASYYFSGGVKAAQDFLRPVIKAYKKIGQTEITSYELLNVIRAEKNIGKEQKLKLKPVMTPEFCEEMGLDNSKRLRYIVI